MRAVLFVLLIACAATLSPPAQSQPQALTTQRNDAAASVPMAEGVASALSASQPKTADKPAANPYGLEALWNGSDNIARAVLVILAAMSTGSWYILITKLFHQAKMSSHARTAEKRFWEAGSVTAGASSLERNSAYRFIAESAVAAVNAPSGLRRHIPMNEWTPMCITAAVDRVQASSQAGLAFLATVGSTSPFVGLLGTVWGIYHALTAIGISGQASIDKVAGPVGEALIMTAIGLAVAIPAVLGYNLVVRRSSAAMGEVREFADELSALVLGSAGKAA